MITKQYTISGVVQGVWFRDFVTKAAAENTIVGTVCNMPDGTVDVVAQGDKSSFTAFELALHDGSPLATVVSVDINVISDCTDTYFDFKQIKALKSEPQSEK